MYTPIYADGGVVLPLYHETVVLQANDLRS